MHNAGCIELHSKNLVDNTHDLLLCQRDLYLQES